MSLQALFVLFNAQPAWWLNLLALFLGVAGAWLLLATRQRERRALAPLAADGAAAAGLLDEPTLRLNRFFYQFGCVCLAAALLLSWTSTRL